MKRISSRVLALCTAAALTVTLAACADNGGTGSATGGGQAQSTDGDTEDDNALETNGPETLADNDGSGLEVAQRFFESSDGLVISGVALADQQVAAERAVADNFPMVLFTGDNGDAVVAEIERLGADTIITVGDVTGLDVGEREVEAVPEASTSEDATHQAVVTAVAGLTAGEAEHPVTLPPVLATPDSSVAAVATTKAAGGDVHLLSYPDPRITSESMQLVQDGDTIALGRHFGSTDDYAARVDLAANGELPGGGGLVFPGRRMIAFYGHPSGDALGIMGEQPPAEAVARLEEHVANYQPLDEQPVIPAFEIIVTVASEYPGEDGNYSNEFPAEDYLGYIDAITEAGGYAVLDLQPGRASFLEQAQLYEELLLRPNVGLAIDPEWRIGPEEMPMQRIGHVEAAEVNEVAQWLADFTRENNLPQKMFIVHQFQMQMVRDRDQIDTSHPELAFVLHADGNGTPEMKFETWNALRQGLGPDWFMAWKNFIDEDTPMFTPEQTFDIEPRPWFVSYQ